MQRTYLALALGIMLSATNSQAQVTWETSATENWQSPTLTNNTSGLVFIRANQSLGQESNTNIAINNRYLTSLSEGHYSTDIVCSGSVQISVAPTKALSNNLSIDPITIQLKPKQIQYIYIEVDNQYRPTLNTLTEESAKQLIAQGYRQTHQISRTNADNCPSYQAPVAPAPVAPVAPTYTAPVPATPPVQQTRPSLALNIHFDHDQANIKPAYKGEISQAAQFLANYPTLTALIEGHTDATGEANYNVELSKRRAEAVRQALIKDHNINPARLESRGYGESQPIADNNSHEGRLQNRRVIIKVPAN